MKKCMAGFAAVLLSVSLLAGCGKSTVTNKDLHKMKVDKYVTLGSYEDLNVSVAPAEVDEARQEELLLAVYQRAVTAENGGITDRAVETGDTIILDYEGKKDGIAFEGGSAQGASLGIGSGSFIEGFEEGLVGVMPGETVDLDLTFPEGYRNNSELAGQDVVFTVTVRYILPDAGAMEDSVVAEMGIEDVKTVEALRAYVYDYLMDSAEEEYLYAVKDALMGELIARSDFKELPEAFLESYKEIYTRSVESIAAGNNVTPDEFTNYYYGMNSADYVGQYAEIQARQEVLLQAIANKEGLAIDDQELDQRLEEYASEMGATSVEVLLEGSDRENYRNYFMTDKVMDFLMERAEITEK